MNAPLKIGGFVLGLGVVFAAAAGIGALTGPVRDEPARVTDESHPSESGHGDMQPGNDDRSTEHAGD